MNNQETIQNSINVEQKDGVKFSVWFFLKLFIGIILIVKAADGFFPIFAIESYNAEAQELFAALKKVPSVGISITAFHFIVGGFILWNTFAPIFVAIATPVFLLATIFEFIYGLALLPQVLALLGLASCVLLLVHYKGHYTDLFVKE